ncbi:unnamed protein product [Mytilus edulis]|uniref:Uncharacterized protein n=1 Tax=Mytilus edulis TaxID=6550 RepID=A0A8S3T873_MYTED|nr:unnamed protein product [Mytilus edulis]
MQASRPRALITPLQLGLGVQVHHNFASRFLVSTLNSLGFCSSYYEVQKFESSAAAVQGVDLPESSASEAGESDVLKNLEATVRRKTEILKQSRTAKLWLQYSEMVQVLRQFIKAERTGNWPLHLQSIQEMLPFLAASGHNLYTKTAYVYLMTMQSLDEDHPDVYANFINGNHVIRRSNRYWAGISSDLFIEQVLMRSVKTAGGLTRGRGMTESQRSLWLMSMPACAEINVKLCRICPKRTKRNHISKKSILFNDTPIKTKKDEFLSNSENKQHFINTLGEKLKDGHVQVIHAEDDADLKIVLTAIEKSKQHTTTVIGGRGLSYCSVIIQRCYKQDLLQIRSQAKHSQNKDLGHNRDKEKNWTTCLQYFAIHSRL